MAKTEPEIWEDKWINTVCGGCYGGCAIRVHRVNGVAVAIEGIVDSSLGGGGGICGKSAAGLMVLYDPNRLNVPLRRTNPEKGRGVDPKWKPITWEEALTEISERMKKIQKDNPAKLWQNTSTAHTYGGWGLVARDWLTTYGSRQFLSSGGSLHCGNGAHHTAGLVHASWSSTVDWPLIKYAIKWGSSKGTGSGHSMVTQARLRSEAMSRGIKEVAFDPISNFAGGKASEWIPILPGTDSAVALSMANYLINDLQMYDREFMSKKTNLSYLVDDGGRYVRDTASGKAQVFDLDVNQAKPYDDHSVTNPALEGEYNVNGQTLRPAFVRLKEHLKQYTPDWAEKVSSVPKETIKRVAREFIEAAGIGSTIVIEGKTFPYRPVGSMYFRGSQGHTNGTHQCWSLDFLNIIAGAEDVPGGSLGWPCIRLGHPDTGNCDMIPAVGQDGVIIPANFIGGHNPWPIHLPSSECIGGRCDDFFTMTTTSGVPHMLDREELWEKLNMKNIPEMLLIWGGNLAVSVGDDQVELFKKIPFIVVSEIYANETAEALADILLPDKCYLERFDWGTNLLSYFFNHAPVREDWAYHAQMPVVEDQIGERRDCIDVMNELAERVGFLDKWYDFLNRKYHITDPKYQIKPRSSGRLSWEEIGDKVLKWCFGDDRGVAYIKENNYIKWPKKIEELYWRWHFEPLQDIRIPVYREHLIDYGIEAGKIGEKVGLELEWAQYTPFPSYFPPRYVEEMTEKYDLIAFSYRDILHTNNVTQQNPWIDEVSLMCPYTYTITLSAETAKHKGLQDGDIVVLETPHGKKEKGLLKVMEGQHPLTVSIAGQAGLWAKGRPIARGKGSNFAWLLKSDLNHYDPLTLCFETAVPVMIYKNKTGDV